MQATIPPRQYDALRMIVIRNIRTIRGLAAAMTIAKASVSQHVNGLVARGLLLRKPDPIDKRSVLLVATAAGRRATNVPPGYDIAAQVRRLGADSLLSR